MATTCESYDIQRLAFDVKDKAAIEDVIGADIMLSRAGSGLKGICPFHKEKTPSLSVSIQKQRYRCFGCGANGDVIQYAQDRDHLDFVDAVISLARKIGLDTDRYRVGFGSKSTRAEPDVLVGVSSKFREWLSLNNSAQKYLFDRGFDEAVLERWSIGYAAKGFTPLLNTKMWTNEQLRTAGLLAESNGRQYEYFRDRIMIPIFGRDGSIIAFGGRVMDDSKPKYLNSPETSIYRKSTVLYGAHLYAQWKSKPVHVVEGYLDVWRLDRHEFCVVAACGTAFTHSHLKQLLRHTKDVIFAFDGDEAGLKAANSVIGILCSHLPGDVRVRIALLPDGEDPDSFVLKHGSEAYSALTDAAPSWVDFAFARIDREHSDNRWIASKVQAWADFCASIASEAWRFCATHRGEISIGYQFGSLGDGTERCVGAAMPPRIVLDEAVALNLIVNYLPVMPEQIRSQARRKFEECGGEAGRRLFSLCGLANDDDKLKREIGDLLYSDIVLNPIPLTSHSDFLRLIEEAANSLKFQSLLQ